MSRIFLTIAYDGTNYSGWQIQKNAVSIQETIEKALRKWLDEDITLIGASRTDAGVHAKGNVAVFDTDSRIPAEKFAYGLNSRLPKDIRIQESFQVPEDFHPRFTETIKTYQYKILNKKTEDPTLRFDTYYYRGDLDVDLMNEGAAYFVGPHDFESFSVKNKEARSTIRSVYSAYVERNKDIISFNVTGNGFLYNMVRIMAGTLMEIGKKNMAPTDIKDIMKEKDRSKAGPTAPAKGLTLMSIEYPLWEL